MKRSYFWPKEIDRFSTPSSALRASFPSRGEMNGGFTLIELLVVVLIIGILAAVAVPQYRIAVEKSHAAEAITQVKALAVAEQLYYLANGEYTTNWEDLDIEFVKNGVTDDNELKQKNMHLDISLAARTNYPRVYAKRVGTGISSKNGRWYIGYFLKTGELFCVVYKTDTKADRICKTFGPGSTCPQNEEANCYQIR